jgi:hypothetical protein
MKKEISDLLYILAFVVAAFFLKKLQKKKPPSPNEESNSIKDDFTSNMDEEKFLKSEVKPTPSTENSKVKPSFHSSPRPPLAAESSDEHVKKVLFHEEIKKEDPFAKQLIEKSSLKELIVASEILNNPFI